MVAQAELWLIETPNQKRRPVLVVTRNEASPVLDNVVVAPITRTVRTIPTSVPVGSEDGLDRDSMASFDNLAVVPRSVLTTKLGELGVKGREQICAALDGRLLRSDHPDTHQAAARSPAVGELATKPATDASLPKDVTRLRRPPGRSAPQPSGCPAPVKPRCSAVRNRAKRVLQRGVARNGRAKLPTMTGPSTRRLIRQKLLELLADDVQVPSIRDLAAAVPVAPATIYHYYRDAEALLHEAERLVIVRHAWDHEHRRAGAVHPMEGLVRLMAKQPAIADLLLGLTSTHPVVPHHVARRLVPAEVPDRPQVISDVLATVAHWHACGHDLVAIESAVPTLVEILGEAQTADLDDDPHEPTPTEEVVATALDAIRTGSEGNRRAILLAMFDQLMSDGVTTTRGITARCGLSAPTIRREGTMSDLRGMLDFTMATVFLGDAPPGLDGVLQVLRTLVEFGTHNPGFFSYIAKRDDTADSVLETPIYAELGHARAAARLRRPELSDEIYVSLMLGLYIRRFHNRGHDTGPWDRIHAIGPGLADELFHPAADG